MSTMRLRLWCVAAWTGASLAVTGGAAVPVAASGQIAPDVGAPPHLLVGAAGSYVAPAVARGTPTCPAGDGSSLVCYTPAFIQQAYDYPTGHDAPTGAGQTIVVVEPTAARPSPPTSRPSTPHSGSRRPR